MYAVINKTTSKVLSTYKSKEAAMIAAQLEKEKRSAQERKEITAVVMDDGGFMDLLF